MFGVYQKKNNDNKTDCEYVLLGEYSNIESLLETCYIDNRKFKDVIMDDFTKILGKD